MECRSDEQRADTGWPAGQGTRSGNVERQFVNDFFCANVIMSHTCFNGKIRPIITLKLKYSKKKKILLEKSNLLYFF